MHNAHYCHLPDGSLGSQPSSANSKIRGGINLLGIVMVVLPPSSTHVALISSPVRAKFCPWLYHSSKNTHLRIASLLPLLWICQHAVQLWLLQMSFLTQKCFNFIYWVLQEKKSSYISILISPKSLDPYPELLTSLWEKTLPPTHSAAG